VLPGPLESRPPPLPEHLQEILAAFWLLTESRPVGWGSASGITAVDVLAVAAAWGFEPTRFLAVIRELDRVFLAHLQEAAKKASKNGGK
jgi:hypothetical protein